MTKPMPKYIKHNGLIGAWLVAPFFVFIILNNLTNQRLYNSMVWHTNVLFVWLILLPALAIILNLAALLRWIQNRRRESYSTAWQALTDFRHSWPALTVAIIGLGIIALVFGHDSVHCIGGNPFQEAANWHSTVQCLKRDSL